MSTSVLHAYRTYFPDPTGGMQEAIHQLCLAITAQGINNTIFTLSPHPHPAIISSAEGRVVRSRSWWAPASCDLGGINAFQSFSKLASQADVLHFFYPWPFGDLLRMLSGHKVPSVLTYVSDIVRQRWLGRAYAPLMWHTLRSMRVIIANSPAYARTSPILSHPAIRDKVRVIPLGIEESSYPVIGDDTVFVRLGLQKNEPFFLFVGVLRYYKGLHTLLQAARDVRARIVIAGTGPENARLHHIASELDLTNILFSGQISDTEKVSLIKHCRAFMLPSHLRSEAFGMALVEGAMLGRPLISCEIGTGTSFVNADQESGFVVPPENPAALASAMQALLQDDRLADTLGKGARARYERLFSGPALGKAYAALFREIAG